MASASDATKGYEADVRFQHLFEMIRRLESKLKTEYTHKLSNSDRQDIERAREALTSIGLQMEQVYADQPGLLSDVPTRKVVQTEWKRSVTNRASGRPSVSGKKRTDPLRS